MMLYALVGVEVILAFEIEFSFFSISIIGVEARSRIPAVGIHAPLSTPAARVGDADNSAHRKPRPRDWRSQRTNLPGNPRKNFVFKKGRGGNRSMYVGYAYRGNLITTKP